MTSSTQSLSSSRLVGRVALVTGAGSGIGRAAALGFAGLWLSFARCVPARWHVYRVPDRELDALDDDAGGDDDVDEVLLERRQPRRSADGS